MPSAEDGSVPSGVGYREGCPLPSRLGVLRKRRKLPFILVRGSAPAGNGLWRRLFVGHRTLFFVPM